MTRTKEQSVVDPHTKEKRGEEKTGLDLSAFQVNPDDLLTDYKAENQGLLVHEVDPLDLLELYKADAGNLPLLESEQEVELAKKIEAGKEARKKLQELEQEGAADSKEKGDLLQAAAEGEKAFDLFFRANVRLVMAMAIRNQYRGVDVMDLIQEGNLGLMAAIEDFDHTLGWRFSTYANWKIWQKINRAVYDQGRNSRLPVNVHDQLRAIEKYERAYEKTHGKPPSPEQIAKDLGRDLSDVKDLLMHRQQEYSLHRLIRVGQDEVELMEFLENDTQLPQETAELASLKEQVITIISNLPDREGIAVLMKFGIGDGKEYTFEEIGDRLQVTKQRASQILRSALRKIKYLAKTRKLDRYL